MPAPILPLPPTRYTGGPGKVSDDVATLTAALKKATDALSSSLATAQSLADTLLTRIAALEAAAAGTTVPTTLPDLVLSSVTMNPAAPSPGQAVSFTAVVKNQGAAALPAGSSLVVSFTVDSTNASTVSTAAFVGGLAVGASTTLSTTAGTNGGNTWTATAGMHAVKGTVDPDGRITESDKTNNTLVSNFTIASGTTVAYDANGIGLTAMLVGSSSMVAGTAETASATFAFNPALAAATLELGLSVRQVDAQGNITSPDDASLDMTHTAMQSTAGWTNNTLTVSGSSTYPAGSYFVEPFYRLNGSSTYVKLSASRKTFTVTAAPSTGGGTTTPVTGAKQTRLLTQFHDEAIVNPMEAHVGRNYEGSCLFNDNVSDWNGIVNPWYFSTESPLPLHWAQQKPTIRKYNCISIAFFPGQDAASAYSGAHDADITAWGNKVMTTFGPDTIIRMGWEMNSWGSQYPWGNTQVAPADYVKAWQRWVTVLRKITGNRFKFDWCVLLDGTDPTPWWPGTDYVDIVDVDLYGSVYGTTNPSAAKLVSWVKQDGPQSLAWLKTWCEKYDKPYGFSEWAMTSWMKSGTTTRGSGDNPEYIQAVWDFIKANNGVANGKPNVYCYHHSYFNRPDGGIGVTLDGNGGTTAEPNIYARYTSMVQDLHPAP